MRILRNLLIGVAVLIGLAVGIGFVLPDTAHVERSVVIDRPPSQVFAVLNSFRRFNDWSPWFERDPHANYTYAGPAIGVGAKESWSGNKDIGSGSQTIVESVPNTSVKTALDFGAMGQASGTYVLTPAGDGTKVTWGLDVSAGGKLIGRYFNLMMDSMVGKDYDHGLAKLKTFLESMPAADVSGIAGTEVNVEARKIYLISSSATGETAKAVLTDAYGRIGAFMKSNSIAMTGAPLTITTGYASGNWSFDAAIPVDRNDAPGPGDVKSGNTYAGKAVQFMHTGPYEKLPDTTTRAYAWLALQGYKASPNVIEEYVNDPTTVPPDQIQTRLTIPVQ